MEQSKLDRINELARKARTAALTEEELSERDRLRKEYISDFRKSLEAQLQNICVVDEKGNKRKLKKT